MRRTLLVVLLCQALHAGDSVAATYASVQDGEFYCAPAGTICSFGLTPGSADVAVVQHVVSVNGNGTPAPPNPLVTGKVNVTAGTFGIYSGMRLVFDGGSWTGGALDACCSGGGVWANQGQLEIGAAALPVFRGVLENNGTLKLLPASSLYWNVGNGGGKVANLTTQAAPAVLQLDGDGRIRGNVVVTNEGILRKTGAGIAVLAENVANRGHSSIYPGRIEVQSGSLAVADDSDGNQGVLYNEGATIQVAGGAVMAIRDGGDLRLVPEAGATVAYTTTGSGGGTLRLEPGGTLYGAQLLPDFSEAARIDFPPGFFQWSGGVILDNALRNLGEIDIVGPADHVIGADLRNAGTLVLDTDHLSISGYLRLLPGSLLDAQDGATLQSGGGNPRLFVDGTLRKRAGAGSLVVSALSLEGSGTVEVNGGRLALPEIGSFYRMNNFHGTVMLIGGAQLDSSGGVLQIEDQAKVTGVGSISPDPVEQRGTLEPGAPYGTVTVGGGLSQQNTAVTRIAIGGSQAASQALLQVNGDLYAQGVLKVNFRDGFAPQAGQSFDLIGFGGNLTTSVANYAVTIEGLVPGFRYNLTQSAQKTVRLTALSTGVSLADFTFADGFED